jgi:hypothetical protein
MKKLISFTIFLFLLCFLGCVGTSSKKRKPEPPRRTFTALENIDSSLKEPFIINEFVSDNISFSKESVCFATALFLADVGILNETSKELFEKYASIIFSGFPDFGQLKEIVIPNLSKSERTDVEKNAYLFITKRKNNEKKDFYFLETNIPINSHYSRLYDGYEVNIKLAFHKNTVPSQWTSVMSVYSNNDILLYRGLAYPAKSAPLVFSGTGVGTDFYMREIYSGKSSIIEVSNNLQEAVENDIKNTVIENPQHAESIKFLEKYANLSYSAYSYLCSNINDSNRYYDTSQKIIVDIPDDKIGSTYNELNKIMDYLLNIIGK